MNVSQTIAVYLINKTVQSDPFEIEKIMRSFPNYNLTTFSKRIAIKQWLSTSFFGVPPIKLI